jgi:hypothetical protein
LEGNHHEEGIMKYLATILILLFASPAFAGGNSSAFSGAQGTIDEPAPIQESPVSQPEPEQEFKINERLYAESIGSNGYYGGGFYGEEKNYAQIPYYTITSRGGESRFISSVVVVEGQILPLNFVSPNVAPFGLGFFPGDISVNIGNFSFLSGGLGQGTFGRGGFRGGSFGFRSR